MMNKIKKNQKPTEHDIHLKYRCEKCGLDHWLSYREASTKGFKVVCNCGLVFKVKRVSGFKLKFYKRQKPLTTESKDTKNQKANTTQNQSIITSQEEKSKPAQIPSDLLEKSVQLLLGYGFTKVEAAELVSSTYMRVPVDNCITLVKYSLQSLGDIQNDICNSQTL